MKAIVSAVILASIPSPAFADEVLLTCSGTYQAPGGVEVSKTGFSISIAQGAIIVGSAPPFDGSYVITRTDDDVVYFRPRTETGQVSDEVQGSINRVSGRLSLINWSKTRNIWFHMLDGNCRTTQRLF